MANPQVPQGSLNRLLASMNFPTTPNLNITSSYLGKNGIHFALEGKSVINLPSMVGIVTSPEPYMMAMVTVELLKSQSFSDLFKQQIETNALLGNATVWPDSTTLSPFNIYNCSLTGIRDLPFNGQDPVFAVTIESYYQVNNFLYGG